MKSMKNAVINLIVHTLNNIHYTLTKNYKILSRLIFSFSLFSLILCTGVSFAINTHTNMPTNVSKKTIGISQIIEHAALDEVRQSLITTLKDQGFEEGKNLTIYYENAQGNMLTATQIALKLATKNLDVEIGISTPATQTLLQALQKQGEKTPLVFTAVTDPVAAKLTPEISHYPISGIMDAPNLKSLIEVLHPMMPNLKKLGVIYNPSETNSVSTVQKLKKLLKQYNIEIVEAVVNTTNDVPEATRKLIGKAQAIYFPQDNTVVAAMQTVINIANQADPKLPVILPIYSKDPAILKGILLSNGYDYSDIGKETGLMVAKILKGANIADIPIQSPEYPKTVINANRAKELGFEVPTSLKYSKLQIIRP